MRVCFAVHVRFSSVPGGTVVGCTGGCGQVCGIDRIGLYCEHSPHCVGHLFHASCPFELAKLPVSRYILDPRPSNDKYQIPGGGRRGPTTHRSVALF